VEEFLLLGQVPGTNLIISFWQWAIIFGLILLVVLGRFEFRYNRVIREQLAKTRALMAKRVDPTTLDQVAL
jgi:hypothetical protein